MSFGPGSGYFVELHVSLESSPTFLVIGRLVWYSWWYVESIGKTKATSTGFMLATHIAQSFTKDFHAQASKVKRPMMDELWYDSRIDLDVSVFRDALQAHRWILRSDAFSRKL